MITDYLAIARDAEKKLRNRTDYEKNEINEINENSLHDEWSEREAVRLNDDAIRQINLILGDYQIDDWREIDRLTVSVERARSTRSMAEFKAALNEYKKYALDLVRHPRTQSYS